MFSFTQGTNAINLDFGKVFFLENAIELLDEPGEFYYNKDEKVIYYYPYKAQDMETAETYVGRVERMVKRRMGFG